MGAGSAVGGGGFVFPLCVVLCTYRPGPGPFRAPCRGIRPDTGLFD